MVEGMIYLLRVGCPWRDLPALFGNWKGVYTRWWRWAQSGLWNAIVQFLAKRAEGRLRAVDSTFLKVHQHAANPAGGQAAHAIGRTKGGLNSKLHAVVDGRGRAVALLLTAGQVNDVKMAPQLLQRFRQVIVVADKAYDSDALYEALRTQQCQVCIANRLGRGRRLPFHRGWYRKRHRVENFFQRAKAMRRFSTRYDKTFTSFFAVACLTAVLDWLNSF